MPGTDLNLLTALDALLAEGSVASAARKLGLSASAMSRTLARLRDATGDPLLVGAVRQGHPLLGAEITAERYAACGHVVASRRGRWVGPVDVALAAQGLARTVVVVVVVVPSFPAALAIACASELVSLVTASFLAAEQERQGRSTRTEAQGLALPVPTTGITVSQMWHPRMDADPAYR